MTSSSDDPRQKFVDMLSSFGNGMAACYPENKQIQETSKQMQVVCSTQWGVTKVLEEWSAYLQRPLPRGVRYAKPLQRLIGAEPTMFHAYFYGDVETAANHANPMRDWIDLQYVLSDPTFDAESRDATLQYMRALNALVMECQGLPLPQCPDRDAIATEIRQHQAQQKEQEQPDDAISMGNSSREMMLRLAREANAGNDLIEELNTNGERDWLGEWHSEMQTPVASGGATLYETVSREDYATFATGVPPGGLLERIGLPTLVSKGDEEQRAASRGIIGQLNILAQVGGSVSASTRGKLEQTAQRLAEQIMSGDVSALSPTDLADIGQDLLDDCDPDDLAELSNKVVSLLPEITNGMRGLGLEQNAAGGDPLLALQAAAAVMPAPPRHQ